MSYEYSALAEPQRYLTKSGKPNDMAATLANEIRDVTGALEGDMSGAYRQMDEYERFWRIEGGWDFDASEKAMREWLPKWQTPDGRNLCDALQRSVTKNPMEFRVPIGAEWEEDDRKAAARLERYSYGVLRMVDVERRLASLRPVQPTAAWQLIVRGMSNLVAQVRSSPRQLYGDSDGDHAPFMWRTPDPRECAFTVDGEGMSAWAHHYYLDRVSLRHRDDLRASYENPSKRDEGLCDTVNFWWRDAAGEFWNATIVENQFSIVPTNHTKRRKLRYIPVFIDSAYGAPPETRMMGNDISSRRWHFQGALENNLSAFKLGNRIMAYQIILLRDAALYGLVTFSNKTLSQDDVKKALTARSIIQLDRDDKPIQVLQPPQMSESIKELQAELNVAKQQGGLPEAASGNVPAGISGILAAIMAQRGDIKAGPVSDALKRLMLGAMECTIEQHRSLERSITVRGVSGNGRSFIEKFDHKALPDTVATMLEAVHEAVLVKDEYGEAQTLATLRNAGMSQLSFYDRTERDPDEAMRRSMEDMMRADPLTATLEMVRVAQSLGRQDLAAAYQQRAQMMMMAEGIQPSGGGGRGNAPREGVDPEAGVVGPGPLAGARVDPSQQSDQQRLGQLGLEYGGR